MNQSGLFSEIFFKKLNKFNQTLDSYQRDPSEKNIHDLRTSIRRLESAYSIFPKSCKTKSSERFIKQTKEFFSFNNKIRDFDIILEKLKDIGYDQESILVLSLTKTKLKRLSKALKYAKNLSDLKKPKIKPNSKINSKYEKKISSLITDFQNYIPVVTENPSKVKELHSMRKTLKKLRYVLEIHPTTSYQNLILQIKQLQQLLGDIHDCDIFIWYFEKHKNTIPDDSKILENEKKKRLSFYKKFVSNLSSFKN